MSTQTIDSDEIAKLCADIQQSLEDSLVQPKFRLSGEYLEQNGWRKVGVLPFELKDYYILARQLMDNLCKETDRRNMAAVGRTDHDHTNFVIHQQMEKEGLHRTPFMVDRMVSMLIRQHFRIKNFTLAEDWTVYAYTNPDE